MVGGLLGAAWLLVPLITDLKYVGQTQLNPTEFQSFGARRELEWLLRGQLFDDNRPNFPLLTMLALLGVVIAVARVRRDAATRVILVFTVVNFVLYFGRPTLGSVVNWIPWLDELPLHRFVGPVQLGALFLAGIAGSAIIGFALDVVRRMTSLRPAYAAVMAGHPPEHDVEERPDDRAEHERKDDDECLAHATAC